LSLSIPYPGSACAQTLNDGDDRAIIPATSTIAKNAALIFVVTVELVIIQQ
jgi:hypothetical protein